MAKVWDHLMKLLAKTNPQHLVSFLLPGAVFVKEAPRELLAQSREIQADILYNVLWQGQETILHVEFQRRHDEDIGRRAWEYNALADILYKLPVCTFFIYLVKDHSIVQPPYQRKLSDGGVSHVFFFKNIYLWELSTEVFKQPGVEGLLPLAPLTKDGAQLSVVEEVITSLQAVQREDLFPLVYAFAALVFTRSEDRQWLQRRFEMLHDILEESWAYQEMFQKATEKGLEAGLQKGLQQGLQAGLQQGRGEERQRELAYQRQALISYVELRFPALVSLLKTQVQYIDDPEALQRLLISMFRVQNETEAKSVIENAVRQQEE